LEQTVVTDSGAFNVLRLYRTEIDNNNDDATTSSKKGNRSSCVRMPYTSWRMEGQAKVEVSLRKAWRTKEKIPLISAKPSR
jgi:hypothetical protein